MNHEKTEDFLRWAARGVEIGAELEDMVESFEGQGQTPEGSFLALHAGKLLARYRREDPIPAETLPAPPEYP